MNLLTKQKETRRHKMNLWLPRGRDSQGVCRVHTAIFKMDNQQGHIVQHMELCSMLCGSLNGREVWGRMDTCICMAQSLHCSPETITTLFIGYIPIQNLKVQKKNKSKNKEKQDIIGRFNIINLKTQKMVTHFYKNITCQK